MKVVCTISDQLNPSKSPIIIKNFSEDKILMEIDNKKYIILADELKKAIDFTLILP